jgi:hypothetical protein
MTKSEEHKRKISEANKGKTPWNKGKKGVQTGSRLGVELSAETRAKISDAHKGKKMPSLQKERISVALTGRKMSDLQKEKISVALTGRKLSDETKRKMSESRKKLWEQTKNAK